MVRDTQDNEPDPWCSIGLQTALIVNKLRVKAQLTQPNEKQNEDADNKRNRSDTHKDCVPEKLEDIERRIADILAMERRLRRNRI
jgi:hypothetical protein